MRFGFHAGRVDWARDISHGSNSKSHGSNISGYICTLVGWLVLGPSYFSQDVVLSGFFTGCLQHYCGVCERKNEKETATHARTISHARNVRPWVHRVDRTSDPTSELVIYAVSGPGKQPSKPTTGAVDLSAGACDPRECIVCCWCLLLVVLLLRLRLLLLLYVWSHFVPV